MTDFYIMLFYSIPLITQIDKDNILELNYINI